MEAEVTIRFLAKLAPWDDSAEEFASDLLYAFGDIIQDVHVLDVEEV